MSIWSSFLHSKRTLQFIGYFNCIFQPIQKRKTGIIAWNKTFGWIVQRHYTNNQSKEISGYYSWHHQRSFHTLWKFFIDRQRNFAIELQRLYFDIQCQSDAIVPIYKLWCICYFLYPQRNKRAGWCQINYRYGYPLRGKWNVGITGNCCGNRTYRLWCK